MNQTQEILPCYWFEVFANSRNMTYTWKNYSTPITLVYGLPILLINFKVIILILKNCKKKEFSSSFYSIFVISTLLDSIFWIFTQLIYRLPLAPVTSFLYDWLPHKSPIIGGILFIHFYLFLSDIYMTIVLSTNRLIAIVFPLKDRYYWKIILPIALTIVFVVPIAGSWKVWLFEAFKCRIALNSGDQLYMLTLNDDGQFKFEFTMYLYISTLISSISNLTINAITISALIIKRKKMSNKLFTAQKAMHMHLTRSELNLFVFSLMIFIEQLIITVLQIIFSSTHTDIQILEIQYFILDIICLTPSLLLIAMSKSVRTEFIKSFWKTSS